jgi:RNA polymerase primary sigma factor
MTPHTHSEGRSRAGGRVSPWDEAGALRELMRAASHPPLQPGEQDDLLRQAARGDRRSQDRLLAAYLPTVVRMAAARGDQGLAVTDLVQEGSIGLLLAVRSFADSGEADFAAFAETRITAQMTVAIEAEAASVRDAKLLVTAAQDYDRTEMLLRRLLRRDPTEQELAQKLEWTVGRTRYVAQVVADARKRHDEELLEFIDPEAIDFDDEDEEEQDAL